MIDKETKIHWQTYLFTVIGILLGGYGLILEDLFSTVVGLWVLLAIWMTEFFLGLEQSIISEIKNERRKKSK